MNTNNILIKCNNGFNGYYLINYSEKLATNLGKALEANAQLFSTIDRAYFIYNSYLLAFSGSNTYKVPALFSSYLFQSETNHLPFSAFVFHMNKISDLMENKNQFFEINVKLIRMKKL